MNTRTYLQIISLVLFSVASLISCKKNAPAPALNVSNVYIKQTAKSDTMVVTVSTLKDSLVTFNLQAAVETASPAGDHLIVLGVDTTQIVGYRNKYNDSAMTLPQANYLMPFTVSTISGSELIGSTVQLNIGSERQLAAGKTYVVPVVVQRIDNQVQEKQDSNQIIYIIVKTEPIDYGIPINKAGWQIASYSTSATSASRLLDNDLSTYWSTSLNSPMPQFVVIDMGQIYQVKAVSFQNWSYVSYGANPTQVEVELSIDGSTWTNCGTFDGGVAGASVHNLLIDPITGGKYIRFTVLQSTSYLLNYTMTAIAEIGANN